MNNSLFAPTRLALAGVVMIFGGEALCILSPLAHERVVHIVCHSILYGGIALVAASAAAYYRSR